MIGQEDHKDSFHFISHTHWDREWYMPFENLRFRLVRLIDNLMDLLDNDPHFSYFHLDGQTIVLEDYFAIRPEQRSRLEAFIRQGRILIGPWYQQNDLFLTSAESTVRNLIEGIRMSRALGGEMKIGYLPDHFGLIGQMPQILNQIGIDNSIFGRGYDYEKHNSPYARWKSPDGSEVLGILMTHWYNNAQRLPEDPDELDGNFRLMKDREEKVNPVPHYLMMNGVDHLEAQENLSHVLDQLRRMFGDESNMIHDNLPNYVKTVQRYLADHSTIPVPVIQGELRERVDYAILGGTLSSRLYIKQANVECHDLIEKWAEPLSVWCALKGLDDYDSDYFRYLWKLYMENHPHDSICGCSQDAVHDHMMDRFVSVKEIANAIIDKKLTTIAKQVSAEGYDKGDQKLLAANTSQVESSVTLKTVVYFLEEDHVDRFCIEDESGRSISYRIAETKPSRLHVISPINLPGVLSVRRYDIELQAVVPPMGYRTYRIRAHTDGHVVEDINRAESASTGWPQLENDKLKVEVQPNGSFTITDKETGLTTPNLGQFEDSGDRGDLYVYTSVSGEAKKLWEGDIQVVDVLSNDLYEECTYRFVWELPVALTEDYTARQAELVPCTFQVTLRLDKSSSQLNIQVDMDNRAKDHRIRYICTLPEKVAEVWAGGQFDVVRRAWDEGKEFGRDCNAQPFWKWVAPLQSRGGLALFGKGTHEYEMMDDERSIAVTLLRCVENINIRESVALETDIQAKGQCIGKHRIDLAIRPFTSETATRLYAEAELFHQGLRTKACPVNDARWEQGRAWVQDSELTGTFTRPDPNKDRPPLEQKHSFVEITGTALVSAIKWAEDRSGPVIRVYNVEPTASDLTVSLSGAFNTMELTNLLEEPQADAVRYEEAAARTVGAKKIETFKFTTRPLV
ncbi:alpha-mannosidase [Cohnella sp. GCM10012308]|uniref:alpha-mannosidase n=1 Tax=Cohnella sp. GCM10012308 TaxID=3317329 RepID=UPI00361A22DD